MTVEGHNTEKSAQRSPTPKPIVPTKRAGGKKTGNTSGHVDHIIIVQGASTNMTSAKLYALADASRVLEPLTSNSNMVPKNNNYRTQITMDVIFDADENCETAFIDPLAMLKNKDFWSTDQAPPCPLVNRCAPNLSNSREIVDLSPIYENSSDACSSHDDVRGSNNDIVPNRGCTITLEDESSTSNSLSKTQSDASLEMGLLSECQLPKHSIKKTKKRVNIVSEANIQSDDTEIEISGLKCGSETSGSPEKSVMSNVGDGYLVMNGTIKRGKKKGQSVDVTLNMSREELEVLEANIVANEINKARSHFRCSAFSGIHIILWSLLCMPIIIVVSGAYSFYIGTITWYNIFVHVSEARKILIRIFASPFVILLYPFLILIFTISLGMYAGLVQLTYNAEMWWKEVCDLEKGFYGWLCGVLHLSDCSPYEVVILTDLKVVENTDMRGHSSTEDISI